MNQHEKRTLRVGFIGCGGHSWRNVYPALQFAPVDLVATCDLDEARAERYARQFGAEHWYTDFHTMFDTEQLDACFIVTNYDERGAPRHAPIARECMLAGVHAWIEKPPSQTVAEIDDLIEVSRQTGKITMVGFKKAFTPANTYVKDIITGPEFGPVSCAYLRYPQALMDEATKQNPASGAYIGFLDHIVHPASLATHLFGPARRLLYRRSHGGAGWATIEFDGGVVVGLQFAVGMAATSFLERLEVIGEGANVTVDNGIKLTYYRPGGHRGSGGYGVATHYMGDSDTAPIIWEPEFSLGQLYNKQLFLLGYAPEVIEFCRCILDNVSPTRGSLMHARQVMAIFEAFLGPEGEWIEV